MLRDPAVRVEAEDIESDLLAHTGEIVDGLQEHLIAIFESADIVDGGLHGSSPEVGNTPDKGISAGSVGEVVLDIAGSQKFLCILGVAGSESVDESQGLFNVRHDRILQKSW